MTFSASPVACTIAITAVVVMALSSCQAEERLPLQYETEHLRIGTDLDYELCAGDFDRYEGLITRLETDLATQMPSPAELYIWSSADYPEDDFCGGHNLGCYVYGERLIYTSTFSVDHELIHAATAGLGVPVDLWGEGAAEALGWRRTLPGISSPSANVGLEPPELEYQVSGHFMRWLWETRGPEGVAALLADSRPEAEAFEALFGQSFAEAEAEYLADSAYSYAVLEGCPHPVVPELEVAEGEPQRWAEVTSVDCGAPNNFGSGLGTAVGRVLEIPAHGFYSLSIDADVATISRCTDETLLEQPVDGDPLWGDVPPLTSIAPGGLTIGLAAGEVTSLELAPGRYELALLGVEGSSVGIDVTLEIGP